MGYVSLTRKEVMVISLILISIIALIGVAGVTIPKKLHEDKIHTHFRVVGDYTFEAISEPDELGYFDVVVTNTKKEVFDYDQVFNDYHAQKIEMMSSMHEISSIPEYQYKYTINFHKKSGFTFRSVHYDPVKNVFVYGFDTPVDVLNDINYPDQVFKSASNFFEIY
jgi:hypothetical protein